MKMDYNQAKEYILTHPEGVLQRDNSGNGWVCPLCGSGTGKNGTGMASKTTDNQGRATHPHFTCFACGEISNEDMLDVIGKRYNLSDAGEIWKKACDLYGIEIERGTVAKTEPRSRSVAPDPGTTPAREWDFTSFFLQAHQNINKTDYHRGLTEETLNKFNIGYVAEWKIPLDYYLAKDKTNTESKWKGIPTSPRLIVPTGKGSYLARDARNGLTEAQEKYKKRKIGKVQIFNLEALSKATQPIVIVEGEIDALSVIDVAERQ